MRGVFGQRRLIRRAITISGATTALLAVAAPGGGVAASLGHVQLAAHVVAVGNAAYVPVGTADLGQAKASQALPLDVVLQPRDPAALQAFATAVSTPGNRLYGHYLRPGAFPSVFGPTSAAINQVTAEMSTLGFHVGTLSANHIILPVATTVGTAERALGVTINSYRLPSGRIAIANVQAPRLPATVGRLITAVIGLDTIAQAMPADEGALAPAARARYATPARHTPAAHAHVTGPQPCSAAVQAGTNFTSWTENQLAQAYSLKTLYSRGDLGAGATIGLYELSNYTASDISSYQSCYATHTAISNIAVEGGTTSTAGEGEVELDIEVVIGLAPRAKLDVYMAPNSNTAALDEYNTMVTQDAADVISSSWGVCEVFAGAATSKAQNTIFEQAATQGQSVFAVPGDEGAEGCLPNDFGVAGIGLGKGEEPGSVAIDPTTHTSYVSDYGGGAVSVVDDLTGSLVGTISLGTGTHPFGVAVDPNTDKIFVTEQSTGELGLINGATCNASTHSNCGVSLDDLEVHGVEPILDGVAVDPATGTVYVAAEAYDQLAVIKASTGQVLAGAAAGDEPDGVAVDVTTNEVYNTALSSDGLAAFSGATCDASNVTGCPKTASIVTTGIEPTWVTVDAALGRVYVSNTDSNTISVLSASTGANIATVDTRIALDPGGSAISPSGTALLVACGSSKGAAGTAGVVVISLKSDTATTILAAGAGPIGVAVDPSIDFAEVADFADSALIEEPLLLSPWDPATQPFVTGVGGTDLEALGPKPTETVWDETLNPESNRPAGAGGGGISDVWSMPSYQTTLGKNSLSTSVPCGNTTGDCREIPDVSASADPFHGYVIFEQGQWSASGGTSAATPLWAAITELLDVQQKVLHKLGFLNPALYKEVARGKPIVNDITAGNDDYTTTAGGLYPATKGYDMASGLGSPIGTGLGEFVGSNPLPTVTSLSPNKGPAAGGTKIVITGTGFMWATGVKFGSKAAKSFEIISPTEVTATAPSGKGTVTVTVTTPGGRSAASKGSSFTS
jgi:YVTN family beta-propeller protein